MPTKTIYVADADLPVFERAQELAGDNLSSTIVQALRRFIAIEEARQRGFVEITVKVGERGAYSRKRFIGRELARRTTQDADTGHLTQWTAYETAHGRFAVHVRRGVPDWSWWQRNWADWAHRQGRDRRSRGREDRGRDMDWGVDWDVDWSDWSAWSDGGASTLDVYDSLDDLRAHVPPELAAAAERALAGEEDEFLDI